VDVAEQAGVAVIADVGNCWTERDVEATIERAAPSIAVLQISDAVWGTPQAPSPGGRCVPGDGDLPLDRFIRAALDGGYSGVFELEMVGPMIDAEGHGSALRRGVERANALLEEVVR
jgi:sugar phosphate isomerase/epimerase